MNNNPAVYVCLSVVLACMAGLAHAGDFLSSDEVKSIYSGKTANGVHLKKDFSYVAYFSPNGTFTQKKDNGDIKKGTWSVDNKGRQCISWDGSGITKCFPLVNNGDGSYTKVKLKGDKRIPLIMHSDFVDGNKLN